MKPTWKVPNPVHFAIERFKQTHKSILITFYNRFHKTQMGMVYAIICPAMRNKNQQTQTTSTRLFPSLAILSLLVLLSSGCGAPGHEPFVQTLPGDSTGHWIPETERTHPYRVIGLDPHRRSYFMLPELPPSDNADQKVTQELERQLFFLNYRFSHGTIVESLPGGRWYVSVPDSAAVTDSLGNEWTYFKDYLRERAGWDSDDLKQRAIPFKTTFPLIWTQDAAELVARSGIAGWELYAGPQDNEPYHRLIAGLTETFPDVFKKHDLPSELSAEGGDLEVVPGPDRKPTLLLGRHRVIRYMELKYPGCDYQSPVPKEKIEEARAAYSEAFGGLPVIIVTERALREPSKASEELFHLDMVASVMDNGQTAHPHVFIPKFSAQKVVDAYTGKTLPSSLTNKVEWEFDEAARQLSALGYIVIRLPFNDHPARSPVNFGKSKDPQTGRYRACLAKYPYHLPQGDPQTPQALLMEAIYRLGDRVEEWKAAGNNDTLSAVQEALRNLWVVIQETDAAPSPLHEQRAKLMRDAGYDVVEVHCYAWGSGSIHCQALR